MVRPCFRQIASSAHHFIQGYLVVAHPVTRVVGLCCYPGKRWLSVSSGLPSHEKRFREWHLPLRRNGFPEMKIVPTCWPDNSHVWLSLLQFYAETEGIKFTDVHSSLDYAETRSKVVDF